jgi:hypothetical protein
MGSWGPALYSDDTTCEVRDTYIAKLESGESSSSACDQVLSQYTSVLDDPQIECLVYLALAETQWKYGRLDDEIKKRAIEIIDSGGDLSMWKKKQ